MAFYRSLTLIEDSAPIRDSIPQAIRSLMAERILMVDGDPVQPQPVENTVGKVGYSGGNGPRQILITPAPTGGVFALNLLDGDGNVRALEDIEADVIRFALAHYRGQMSEVVRRLRIGRSTLYRKLEVFGCTVTNNTGT